MAARRVLLSRSDDLCRVQRAILRAKLTQQDTVEEVKAKLIEAAAVYRQDKEVSTHPYPSNSSFSAGSH
jgi:hypothetical protein